MATCEQSSRRTSPPALSKKKWGRKKKKRKYAAVWWAIPLSAAAIREHNVKCHSGSVSSAALSQGKGQEERRRGEALSTANPIGRAGFSNARQRGERVTLWQDNSGSLVQTLSCHPAPIRGGTETAKIWLTGNMHLSPAGGWITSGQRWTWGGDTCARASGK